MDAFYNFYYLLDVFCQKAGYQLVPACFMMIPAYESFVGWWKNYWYKSPGKVFYPFH